jgi:4a-hydroxytetrahydrobiopterin dehydratase
MFRRAKDEFRSAWAGTSHTRPDASPFLSFDEAGPGTDLTARRRQDELTSEPLGKCGAPIMSLLSDPEISDALATLQGWRRREQAIEKEFAFAGFPDAMAFLVRLAFEAEAADHHPDIVVHYRRVTLQYSTHSEGGLTMKDVEGARMAERVAAGLGGTG